DELCERSPRNGSSPYRPWSACGQPKNEGLTPRRPTPLIGAIALSIELHRVLFSVPLLAALWAGGHTLWRADIGAVKDFLVRSLPGSFASFAVGISATDRA